MLGDNLNNFGAVPTPVILCRVQQILQVVVKRHDRPIFLTSKNMVLGQGALHPWVWTHPKAMTTGWAVGMNHPSTAGCQLVTHSRTLSRQSQPKLIQYILETETNYPVIIWLELPSDQGPQYGWLTPGFLCVALPWFYQPLGSVKKNTVLRAWFRPWHRLRADPNERPAARNGHPWRSQVDDRLQCGKESWWSMLINDD